MTVGENFHDYQRSPDPTGIGGRCSPGLIQLSTALKRRWDMRSLGCYGVRPIRGGSSPSSHSTGSAVDLSFLPERRAQMDVQVLGYLIAWSNEWGIQAVHDYRGQRIWRAGRTGNIADCCSLWWKAQRKSSNGMGQSWANWYHIEVHPDRWGDVRTESERSIQ